MFKNLKNDNKQNSIEKNKNYFFNNNVLNKDKITSIDNNNIESINNNNIESINNNNINNHDIRLIDNNYEFHLSVLILTIPSCKEKFNRLINKINKLIENLIIKIEILTNNSDETIGKKRNELINLSKGIYSVFIDDDDLISDEYFQIFQNAILSNKDFDCINLNMEFYINNKFICVLHHSIKYNTFIGLNKYKKINLNRYIYHLNIIKTNIFNKIGFPEISFGEDIYFQKNLLLSNLVKNEYYTDSIQYYYYYNSKKNNNTRMMKY